MKKEKQRGSMIIVQKKMDGNKICWSFRLDQSILYTVPE